ncbi:hypothetical protein B7P43_G18457 [Cryptotermes secundus]|uniref:Uncharacterized protein n=1 Tax=Cryptotermes secundus TaxID=105785 RepID=A0A2J7Q565_9NEOP|nr:hypothetical protein B7P43_G18457 [Cryptotermes secundus]
MSVSKLLSEEVRTGNGKIRRTQRGLINIFGYGLKYLFGTADTKDVKRLNAVCDNLQSFQRKVIHTTEQQLTYLHTLDEATKANAKATLDLAKALRNSIQNFYTICPSNMVLRKSSKDNCLIALFTRKTEAAMKKCKRVLLREFEPVWIRSPDAKYWVYSLGKSTHITLKCRPLGGSPLDEDETADIWLNGNGVLPNTSTCYIYAETFKLLPHSLGRTVAGLNRTRIILSNIETLINPNEQELLQNHSNSSVHLQEIDDVVKGITRNNDRAGLDVTPLLENLRQRELAPSANTYCIIGISICILLVTTSCRYYKK